MARLTSLKIQGYRPFRDFQAIVSPLEILVGSNGSGKSALFEFLKFLRDSTYQEIPPEIIAGSIGQEIFHIPGDERFLWNIAIDLDDDNPIRYQGRINGPIGRTQVVFEQVNTNPPDGQLEYTFMEMRGQVGIIREDIEPQEIMVRANQFALSTIHNGNMSTLYHLRGYISGWRFYSSFRIANDKIRRPVPIEQTPVLHEDAGNLSAVLFYLSSEHRDAYEELQSMLRLMIPGFKGLSIKAQGLGLVMAFWQEGGIDRELSLADLSDGILRLLCWTVLCVMPNPPTLMCIDEPDQGVHPRTLPILAGLFQKASERTQVFLATHASYFLTQFPLEAVAIMRKENGEAKWIKPSSSQLMIDLLNDFGVEELEQMHRNDELERLS